MRRTLSFAICLVLILAAGAALAADSAKEKQWWGKAPGQKPIVNGTVANVSSGNIAVKTKDGVKAFVVVAKTNVIVRGQKSTMADVKVGDPVVVHFVLQRDNVPAAARVIVRKPGVAGKIVSFQNNVLVLKSKTGQTRVLVTEKTAVRSRNYVGTPQDLRVGYGVEAVGTPSDNGLVADTVIFRPTASKGTVVSVENGVVTVKTVKQLNIQLQTSNATAVLVRPRVGPNKKGTLADIKVGSPVNVGFHAVQGGVSPLLWVDVLTGM